MTPAARIQSAIELLTVIESGKAAADRAAAGFFRARRFIGAKDRRAVAERVYGILRCRGVLLWRLRQAGAEATPRALMVAALLDLGGASPEGVAMLFNGGKFAPPPLDPQERALLAHLAAEQQEAPPDWAVGNYPEWLDAAVKERFGAGWLNELAALAGRAPLDLRVNTLLTGRDEALAALRADGIEAEATAYSPIGIRLAERGRITAHPLFRAGAIEVQDEGSQLAALLTDARPGQQVVDFCAGAGGKSLAMAATMANKGQIYAADIDRRRLAALGRRAQRAGIRNLQGRRLARLDAPWLAELDGRADRVLIDAPCSGTGTWRRNPETRWRLTPEVIRHGVRTQDALLARGGALVRPGGRLVYVTCSFLREENEARVEHFLRQHADFRLLPITQIWLEILAGTCPAEGGYLMLTPARHDTDAFFVAVLARGGL